MSGNRFSADAIVETDSDVDEKLKTLGKSLINFLSSTVDNCWNLNGRGGAAGVCDEFEDVDADDEACWDHLLFFQIYFIQIPLNWLNKKADSPDYKTG